MFNRKGKNILYLASETLQPQNLGLDKPIDDAENLNGVHECITKNRVDYSQFFNRDSPVFDILSSTVPELLLLKIHPTSTIVQSKILPYCIRNFRGEPYRPSRGDRNLQGNSASSYVPFVLLKENNICFNESMTEIKI